MGMALGVELMAQGCELAGHLNRTSENRRLAAQRLGVPAAPDLATLAASGPELWLLTVPDASLPQVSNTLSPMIEPGQFVVHTSGATSVSVLAPCAERGAVALAFHPLQTVTTSPEPELFRGVTIAVTPDSEQGWEAGLRLAELLGALPFRLADEDRGLYHAAGVFVSNYVVSLAWLAQKLFQRTGMPADTALQALLPLMSRSVENLRELGVPRALTGPLLRGDVATVKIHLKGLEDEPPEALAAYHALAQVTLGLLDEYELLSSEKQAELEQLLGAATPREHAGETARPWTAGESAPPQPKKPTNQPKGTR